MRSFSYWTIIRSRYATMLSDYVYYGYITVNESSSVHLSLKAPDTAGPHRLVVLLATDPFVDGEIAPGVMNTNITGSVQAEYIDLFVNA